MASSMDVKGVNSAVGGTATLSSCRRLQERITALPAAPLPRCFEVESRGNSSFRAGYVSVSEEGGISVSDLPHLAVRLPLRAVLSRLPCRRSPFTRRPFRRVDQCKEHPVQLRQAAEAEREIQMQAGPSITRQAANMRRAGSVGERLHAESYKEAIRRLQREAAWREANAVPAARHPTSRCHRSAISAQGRHRRPFWSCRG